MNLYGKESWKSCTYETISVTEPFVKCHVWDLFADHLHPANKLHRCFQGPFKCPSWSPRFDKKKVLSAYAQLCNFLYRSIIRFASRHGFFWISIYVHMYLTLNMAESAHLIPPLLACIAQRQGNKQHWVPRRKKGSGQRKYSLARYLILLRLKIPNCPRLILSGITKLQVASEGVRSIMNTIPQSHAMAEFTALYPPVDCKQGNLTPRTHRNIYIICINRG